MNTRSKDLKSYILSMLGLYLMLGGSWLLAELLLPYFWALKLEATSVQDLINSRDRLIAEFMDSVYLLLVCLAAYASLIQFMRIAYFLVVTPTLSALKNYGMNLFLVWGMLYSLINFYITKTLVMKSKAMSVLLDEFIAFLS